MGLGTRLEIHSLGSYNLYCVSFFSIFISSFKILISRVDLPPPSRALRQNLVSVPVQYPNIPTGYKPSTTHMNLPLLSPLPLQRFLANLIITHERTCKLNDNNNNPRTNLPEKLYYFNYPATTHLASHENQLRQ